VEPWAAALLAPAAAPLELLAPPAAERRTPDNCVSSSTIGSASLLAGDSDEIPLDELSKTKRFLNSVLSFFRHNLLSIAQTVA